jgi:hypothetical protein
VRILMVFWISAPERGAWQALALTAAWTHACIGIHYWLRFRPWYPRLAAWLLTAALLIPAAALAGFVAGGREVQALARTPGWTVLGLPSPRAGGAQPRRAGRRPRRRARRRPRPAGPRHALSAHTPRRRPKMAAWARGVYR